jgi:hypothetical protein
MGLTSFTVELAFKYLTSRYDSGEEMIEAVADRLGIEVYLSPEAALEDLSDLADPLAEFEDLVMIDPRAVRSAPRNDQTEILTDLAERLELPETAFCRDPVEKIVELDDDPAKAYVWILGHHATGENVASLKRHLDESYRENFGHEPRATHLIVANVDDLRELTEAEVEEYLKPWLRERERAGGERGQPLTE